MSMELCLYVYGTSSDQFGAYSLANMFLYFEILTQLPTWNLGCIPLESTLYSAY